MPGQKLLRIARTAASRSGCHSGDQGWWAYERVLAAPPRRLCFIALYCPSFGEADRPNVHSPVWNRVDEAIAPGASRRTTRYRSADYES